MKAKFLMAALMALAAGAGPALAWNEMTPEKQLALSLSGDRVRGEVAFEICRGCHRVGALGRPDGSYPRLAGQHRTVLIKQIVDVRAGLRENAKMLPFADSHAITPQDIADISVYLEGLPVPADQGQGAGHDLVRGKALYEKDCTRCHGEDGEGSSSNYYPRVSGQHYRYLYREGIAIRDGQRRNANPKMADAVRSYSDGEMAAVTDYMSRLPVR